MGAASSMNLPRPFGPYELVRQLAVGGMAEVFVARARSVAGFEKVVALKMIHSRFSEDPEFARLLVEEANITAQLSHRNIVQVIDLGQVDGTHYIAMEFVDGMDLSRMIAKLHERGETASPRLAAFIVREVCDALDAAHRRNGADGKHLKIIHRDVSPPNILLGMSGEVKLTDFGIAKAALRASSTEVGVVKGKYAYMSPEQARAGVLDARTDVFAAGAVLYELATGEPVYREAPLAVLLERVSRGLYDPPEQVKPDLAPALCAVITRALAVAPADRYPSARAMADDLNAFLYSLPPNAEFELTQMLGSMIESGRASVPPMASTSLIDDDSDESTQIETMAVMRSKMLQASPRPAAKGISGASDFTDEPTRAVRKTSLGLGDAIPAEAMVKIRPNTAAPRPRKATPTPGPLPAHNAPSAPGPSRTPSAETARVLGTPSNGAIAPPPRQTASGTFATGSAPFAPEAPSSSASGPLASQRPHAPTPSAQRSIPAPDPFATAPAPDSDAAATLFGPPPVATPSDPPPMDVAMQQDPSLPPSSASWVQPPPYGAYAPQMPAGWHPGPSVQPPPAYGMIPTWTSDAQHALEVRQRRALIAAAIFATVAVLTLIVVLLTVH